MVALAGCDEAHRKKGCAIRFATKRAVFAHCLVGFFFNFFCLPKPMRLSIQSKRDRCQVRICFARSLPKRQVYSMHFLNCSNSYDSESINEHSKSRGIFSTKQISLAASWLRNDCLVFDFVSGKTRLKENNAKYLFFFSCS